MFPIKLSISECNCCFAIYVEYFFELIKFDIPFQNEFHFQQYVEQNLKYIHFSFIEINFLLNAAKIFYSIKSTLKLWKRIKKHIFLTITNGQLAFIHSLKIELISSILLWRASRQGRIYTVVAIVRVIKVRSSRFY